MFNHKINEFEESSKHRTWVQALDHCRRQSADLVSVHSSEEQDAISRFIKEHNVGSLVDFWMGLNDLKLEGKFSWSDGKKLLFLEKKQNDLFSRFLGLCCVFCEQISRQVLIKTFLIKLHY